MLRIYERDNSFSYGNINPLNANVEYTPHGIVVTSDSCNSGHREHYESYFYKMIYQSFVIRLIHSWESQIFNILEKKRPKKALALKGLSGLPLVRLTTETEARQPVSLYLAKREYHKANKKVFDCLLKNNKNAAFAKIIRFDWLSLDFRVSAEFRTGKFCGKTKTTKISNCLPT